MRAGCFVLIVFLLSCGCLCSVSLPCDAVGWSVTVAFPGDTHLFLGWSAYPIIPELEANILQ